MRGHRSIREMMKDKAADKTIASLKLSLKADSGYSSKEEHRITIEQWNLIREVLTGSIEIKLK